ncbi:MAG: efflux RND transporter periplasmic adaptor subunit [Magnetococcales bacterium]|nr:efflux RND transporter periplasmic adaptor subunit [Magnetococcales bacterium]
MKIFVVPWILGIVLGLAPPLAVAGPDTADAPSKIQTAENTEEAEGLRGLLVASQEAILSSDLAGRILEIRRDTRQKFNKGEVLIRFHCPDREARLQKAKAQLAAIDKRLNVQRKLVELRSTSLLDVELLEAERLGALAEMAIHQAEIGQCTLLAPFDGRVAERLVKPFETVTQGQPLLDITGLLPFEIHILLPSNLLSRIKSGMPVSIDLDETGKHYPARIDHAGGRINPAGQTVRVVARMATFEEELLPGMSGPVRIEFSPSIENRSQ